MKRTDGIAGDVIAALGLLTRLPLPGRASHRGAEAAWAWPLAGLTVALLAAVLAGIGGWIGLPVTLCAGLLIAALVVMTGALHEDGLADVADGFWGGFTNERRLEIMKDSRIGSYGVIALVLSLGLRWQAVAVLIAGGAWIGPLLAAAMLSRAPMAVLLQEMPNARGVGLSQAVGRPGRAAAATGMLVTLGVSLLLAGSGAVWVALAVALAAFGVARVAQAKVGGQTGDVLGATQQVSEVVALCAFAALA
ncbi:adenosylcobinamide-GDP ribazoletransferase [Psychromarinibacter halotolerans]|uniref:Adenosylcobinamide-GDP ribazoletransferase n=1 Tax=Psychromarinibacter halotolerans TaxID=1775175 RepID=A0ABV7GM30_9RHOB|nr:adenosylcobinamide-GDP ribazoletransferase [Psychromarinibacter halotolerans]MDF0597259.1 adenosylcobinamide-GDP ribazoletransferase [Psychromarinibacter halotolerans]